MNEIIWSIKIDKILNNGVSLESIGIKNWAFSKEKALLALGHLANLEVPVLGGDVCELTNGTIQYNYDNWYCDRLPNESYIDFVNRSINKAIEYIEQYDSNDLDKIFFVFVQ